MKIYTENDETLIIDITEPTKSSKRLKMRRTQLDQYIEGITTEVFSGGKYERCTDNGTWLSEEVPSGIISK